jgi:hypothetical protein
MGSNSIINRTNGVAVAPIFTRVATPPPIITFRFKKRGVVGPDGFTMYLAGGQDSRNVSIKYNDVYKSIDGINWSLVRADGDPNGFTQRSGFGFVVMGSKFWIFGGVDSSGNFLNDCWNSDDCITWLFVKSSCGWTARHEFGYCVWNDGVSDKIWFAGGYDGVSKQKDVWCTEDGIMWNLKTADFGSINGLRECGMCGYASGDLYIIAGDQNPFRTTFVSSDGITWAPYQPGEYGVRRDIENAVQCFSYNGGEIIIACGENNASRSVYKDIWITDGYDGSVIFWEEIPQEDGALVGDSIIGQGRSDCILLFTNDGVNEYLYLIGGMNKYKEAIDDVWRAESTITNLLNRNIIFKRIL